MTGALVTFLSMLNEPRYEPTKRHSFAESVVMLIFHIAGTAVIFLALAAVTWIIGVALHWLNSIHPFPQPILDFFISIELGLLYVDAIVSGFVLLAGTWKFVKDISGVRS